MPRITLEGRRVYQRAYMRAYRARRRLFAKAERAPTKDWLHGMQRVLCEFAERAALPRHLAAFRPVVAQLSPHQAIECPGRTWIIGESWRAARPPATFSGVQKLTRVIASSLARQHPDLASPSPQATCLLKSLRSSNVSSSTN